MAGEVVTWGAAIAAIGALLSIVGFWTRFSDRITEAENKATSAEEDAREARKALSESDSTIHALGAKLYQTEIWARDEFVRKASFEGVVTRMERGLADFKSEINTKLDRMTDRIEHLGHSER